MDTIKKFNKEVWEFYKMHGREFPWRRTHDPYKILVSELMLQQTQVNRVVPFYKKFLKAAPSVRSLAVMSTRELLLLWQGLGYNRRALYLRECAKNIFEKYHGRVPCDPKVLETLPGIGPNTAGAVCAYAFNMPVPFIETNIRKTFIHFFFVSGRVDDREILDLIEKTVDQKNPREWYYAVVDYGAHLGKTRVVSNARSAHYVKQSKFVGSNRQVRAALVRFFVARKRILRSQITLPFYAEPEQVENNIDHLIKEGFLTQKGKFVGVSN